ncbi:hypothetical protein CTAYLR_004283 [Chrysophaeum taylorii]|uniref:Protein kinase domain-containing protein n=1 Tax=Chrysophaeum taylorii TaxID=2483200 RepID=A0AAD7XM27_9STRA|nr:hypothetical protein CTAYLR_004283 [Chrysophaeum taylorii]
MSGVKTKKDLRFSSDSEKGEKTPKRGFDECQPFHVLAGRYSGFAKIGSGAYGVVCSGVDARGSKVAIKRVHPWADDEWDARHTLRELRLMRLLCGHPNVITLVDSVLCPEGSNDLFIVMELMESDLHRIIASKQVLTPAHVSCLSAQLLLGIQAMHSIGVLHRDLKPGNLLVSRGCQLRITDFGLSRYVGHAAEREYERKEGEESEEEEEETKKPYLLKNPLTEYVVTRWYRCPEVLLAPHLPYTTAVDCWSAGCIFAELVRRKPAFCGKNFVNQVQVILERLGTPEDLGFEPREDAARFLAKQPAHKPPGLKALMPGATPQQLRFAGTLLRFNPRSRASVEEALADSYFNDAPELPGRSRHFFPEDGVSRAACAFRDAVLDDEGFEFGFENSHTTLDDLRDAVRDDVRRVSRSRDKRLLDKPETLFFGGHKSPIAVPPSHDDESKRPSRRLFGLPLLRKNKKTTHRVRPSPSSTPSDNSIDSADKTRTVTAMLSRLRSVSAR